MITPEIAEKLQCLRLNDDFINNFWRKEAVLLRGKAQQLSSFTNWAGRFQSWCKPPVKARLFTTRPDGTSLAAVVDSPTDAHELFCHFSNEGEPVTLLLNRVETSDHIMGQIHRSFAVGQDWRRGDIVATLSTAASGIGYHAGNEDGFIIQLEGRRHWRAWASEHTPEAYRRQLLGLPNNNEYVASRSQEDPLLDVILQPGDILYLPPLFAHEGLTLERSVSLSVAWRGITPYTFLKALLGDRLSTLDDVEAKIELYETLLQDPPYETPIADRWAILTDSALNTVVASNVLRTAAMAYLSKKAHS